MQGLIVKIRSKISRGPAIVEIKVVGDLLNHFLNYPCWESFIYLFIYLFALSFPYVWS